MCGTIAGHLARIRLSVIYIIKWANIPVEKQQITATQRELGHAQAAVYNKSRRERKKLSKQRRGLINWWFTF